MKTSLLIFTAFFLAGCQSYQERAFPDREDSPFVYIPVNSKLVLNEAAEIPANMGRVYLQDGEFRDQKLVDLYYPNCSFESRKVLPAAQIIQPDSFIITKVYKFDDWSKRFRTRPAALYFLSDGASPEPWSTLLYLSSEKQPDIYRMTCEHWEEPTDANHLSIRQIRKALGKKVTLHLAEGTLS